MWMEPYHIWSSVMLPLLRRMLHPCWHISILHLFLLVLNNNSFIWICHILVNSSWAFGLFSLLIFMTNTAVNVHIYVFVWMCYIGIEMECWGHMDLSTLFLIFLITAIIVGMKWYLTVVLICITLKTNDAEYLFKCLLVIFISSLKNCLFKSLVYFFFNWVIWI